MLRRADCAVAATEPLLPDGAGATMQGSDSEVEADNFYSLLNLEPSATPEQIKRSYRKLALRFHPDKNPDSGEMFQKISTAYATLSNPQRRQVYDRFGEQGVQIMEQAEAHGVPAWILNPVAQSGLLLVLLCTVLLLFLVLPILACMRIDGGISWPWAAVLTPIWLTNAVILFAVVAGGARERSEEGGGRCGGRCRKPCPLSITHIHLLLIFACEVLVAIKVDSPDAIGFSYSIALAPLTALLLLRVAFVFRAFGPAAAGCNTPAGEEADPARDKATARAALARSLVWLGLQLSLILLLGARLDGAPNVAWWGVLVPAWGLMALFLLQSAALFASTRETVQVRNRPFPPAASIFNPSSQHPFSPLPGQCHPHPPPSPPPLYSQQEERMARRALAVASMLLGLLASLSLFLLSLRLASVPISAAHILTPYFVVLGLAVCCGLLGCLVGAAAASADESELASQGVRLDPGQDSTAQDGVSGRSAGSVGGADTGGGASSEGGRADSEGASAPAYRGGRLAGVAEAGGSIGGGAAGGVGAGSGAGSGQGVSGVGGEGGAGLGRGSGGLGAEAGGVGSGAGGLEPRTGGGAVIIDVDDVVGLGQRLRSADALAAGGGRCGAESSPASTSSRGRSTHGAPAAGNVVRTASSGAAPVPSRSESELRAMSVRELKEELRRCGVSSVAGVLEKGDLLSLALNANGVTAVGNTGGGKGVSAPGNTGGGNGRTSPKNLLD